MKLGIACAADDGVDQVIPEEPTTGIRAVALQAESAPNEAATEDTRDVLTLWWGVVEGRWSIVERFEAQGRRYYVVRQNSPELSRASTLHPIERRLIALLAAGHSEKAAAYALGLGPPTVSALLKGALVKLGLRSRMELVQLLSIVGPPGALGVLPEGESSGRELSTEVTGDGPGDRASD